MPTDEKYPPQRSVSETIPIIHNSMGTIRSKYIYSGVVSKYQEYLKAWLPKTGRNAFCLSFLIYGESHN